MPLNMTDPSEIAPGTPGRAPYRAKTPLSGLGAALSPSSKVSFSLSRGIVSEVCFPDTGHPCAQHLEWIVTDGQDFFSEEKRHTFQEVSPLEEGVPAYRLVNHCVDGRYRITKEVITDPLRDTILQKTRFAPLGPSPSGQPYRLFLSLAPFIGGDSAFHNARVSRYRDHTLLVAQKAGVTLALLCSHPFRHSSVGYSGISDGWLDLAAHRRMTREYARVEGGHVSLTAEIELGEHPGTSAGSPAAVTGTGSNAGLGLETDIIVTIGLGQTEHEAASKAWASLLEGFESAKERYMAPWRTWQHGLSQVTPGLLGGAHVKTSAQALRTLESKTYPGALVSRQGVRPRELAAAFDAFQALGAREDAQRLLAYLMAAQEERGFWAQSLNPDGTPASAPVARDQVAQVILMVDTCRRTFQLTPAKMQRYWPLVWTAAAYLVGGGPEAPADRWDGTEALSLHTLCVTVAALLAAADMADERGQPGVATYCRKTADYLHEHIDIWTYVHVGPGKGPDRIAGYYTSAGAPGHKPSGPASPDVLSLVRYGLRKPGDPRVLDTLKVVDADLKLDSPLGPCWQKRAGDDNAWLLLTAERALYELSAGNKAAAATLLKSLEDYAPFGLFPERTECGEPWNPQGDPLPDIRTQSEYVRLCCALKAEHAPDLPRFTADRYIQKSTPAPFERWRPDLPCPSIPKDKKLRIELPHSALIHWTDDDWATKQHTLTRDTRLGVHVAELTPRANARQLIFTFFWLTPERWENKNYTVPLA